MKLADAYLHVAVHIGFAGSRRLLDVDAHPSVSAVAFDKFVEDRLVARLAELPGQLGLSAENFLCGVSQIAIGADTLFCRSCQKLQFPQRILLPQHREEYLLAIGSDGKPDFSDAERETALELLAGDNIVHEWVVSDARDRLTRFEEVNLEIVRVSDLLVCLIRDDAEGKRGGTNDLLDRAKNRNKPVLEIRVALKDGQLDWHETWHRREDFRVPTLPRALIRVPETMSNARSSPPSVADYCNKLKTLASGQANWQRKLFKWAILLILGTHILATICAVTALGIHGANVIPWLLGGELLLLAAGFSTHEYLHRSRASRTWAVSRLAAEVARSVWAVGNVHVKLDHLFTLPFPPDLLPLLRTIDVLHLHSTHSTISQPWERKRNIYVTRRLTAKNKDGQLNYYCTKLAAARFWLRLAQGFFLVFSALAFLVTLLKLLVMFHGIPVTEANEAGLTGWLGAAAVVLPALAVAALSLSAVNDLEARVHTFAEALDFLNKQTNELEKVDSEREFTRLLLETESRLLGETVNWYYRVSYNRAVA